MKTVLRTQPGFFAAETNKSGERPGIPKGKMHIHVAIIETYELDLHADKQGDLDISFPILAALPSLMMNDEEEQDKAIKLKTLLLQLGEHIKGNEEHLK